MWPNSLFRLRLLQNSHLCFCTAVRLLENQDFVLCCIGLVSAGCVLMISCSQGPINCAQLSPLLLLLSFRICTNIHAEPRKIRCRIKLKRVLHVYCEKRIDRINPCIRCIVMSSNEQKERVCTCSWAGFYVTANPTQSPEYRKHPFVLF